MNHAGEPARRPRIPGATVFAMAVLAVLTMAGSGSAYWSDVHYHLTYYLSRLVGYTPEQAWRIAAADDSLDYSPATEPGQEGKATAAAQGPRWKFHALRDDEAAKTSGPRILEGDPDDEADAAVVRQRHALNLLALEEGNPGPFLHFFQDELPHLSYGSVHGHWVSNLDQARALKRAGLPIGGAVDWLSFHPPEYGLILARDCSEFLLDTMKRLSPAQGKARGRMPSDAELKALVDALRKVNPAPPPLEESQLAAFGLYHVSKGLIAPEDKQLAGIFARHLAGPDAALAHAVVAEAMKAKGMVEMARKGRGLPDAAAAQAEYEFDASGRIASAEARDRYVIAGDLEVILAKDLGTEGKPFDVVVKAPSTMAGEKEVELTRSTGMRPGGTAKFENLPVGVLVLEAVQGDRVIARNSRAKVLAVKNRTALGLPRWVHRPEGRKVTWAEGGLGWTSAAGYPSFSPAVGTVERVEELMGDTTCSRLLPGSAKFLESPQAMPAGHLLELEAEASANAVAVTVTHVRGAESGGCVLSFAWIGKIPEEMFPGDEFTLKVLGTGRQTGTLAADTPSSARLTLANDLGPGPAMKPMDLGGPAGGEFREEGKIELKIVAGPGDRPAAHLVFRVAYGGGRWLEVSELFELEPPE